MNLGLTGEVVLVMGGARDIGREISLMLAREGAAVAVNHVHSKAEAAGAIPAKTKLATTIVAKWPVF